MCGWALRSVAPPWVAQRVWLMPKCPVTGSSATTFASSAIRPAFLRRCSSPPAPVTMPELSYPRYSSRFSPSSRMGAASRWPVKPMIPHMREALLA